jgi:release factor glutamine methyltransferase
MKLQQALHQAKADLASITDNPDLEAEMLLSFVLDKPRSFLHAWPETSLTLAQTEKLASLLVRRSNQEPMAYLTGKREFWSLELLVTKDTLIPRPETELVVETALTVLKHASGKISVMDLGTGSGAIALALACEQPDWHIVATDISQDALHVAKQNAERFTLKNITFFCGHWFLALQEGTKFDLVVSNPPYIAQTEWDTYAAGLQYEPISALVSGEDGLDAIREISCHAKAYLKPGGYVLVEHGFLQGEAVRRIFASDGYTAVSTIRDVAEQERVTIGRLI